MKGQRQQRWWVPATQSSKHRIQRVFGAGQLRKSAAAVQPKSAAAARAAVQPAALFADLKGQVI